MLSYVLAPIDDPVSFKFILIMLAIFVIAFVSGAFKIERLQGFARYAPNALTTIGVIGTFTGIYIGLVQFDVQNIDESVPALLSGMKIAFSTSILGMFLAVVLKLSQTVEFRKTAPSDVSAAAFIAVLHDLLTETKTGNSKIDGNLNELKSVIVGDADSSLITQLQKLRTSVQDTSSDQVKSINAGFETLAAEFKAFAEKVAEDGSEKLIEALNNVIRDFNDKITEQFGENFKHLNEAVGNLLAWQDEHKRQMSDLISQIELSQEAISKSETSLVAIRESAEEIPNSMDNLKEVIGLTATQLNQLEDHLSSFAEIRNQAVEALPQIENTVSKLTVDFSNAVTEAAETTASTLSRQTETITRAIETSESAFKQTTEKYEEALENLQTQMTALPSALDQSAQALHSTVEKIGTQLSEELSRAITEQTGEMRKTITSLQESVVTNMSETNGVIKESFSTFDHQMQEEIKQTIEAMGSHLTSLSNQFVQDYAPLTEKLRELVNVASRAPSRA
ncbi:hypothetical protein [Thalassospira sp. MIT1370]|uniref:hypothetical protein n=1 Tax=unclassified Thalassospira TaxID=2648997 RepID=UPI00399AFD8C